LNQHYKVQTIHKHQGIAMLKLGQNTIYLID
jgi:hypothetical protein